MFRIFTEISGGVTGTRSAYMKEGGKELRFETRAAAQKYIDACRAGRSPYAIAKFDQRYEIESDDADRREVSS